jgi:formylglycine-generating enzyme required for sulfatase activity
MKADGFDVNKDYYALLGIPSDAKTEAIQAAFERKLAAYPSHEAAYADPAFGEIEIAYNVLSTPDLRRRYDLARWQKQVEAFRNRRREEKSATGDMLPPRAPEKTGEKTPKAWAERIILWIWVVPLLFAAVLFGLGLVVSLFVEGVDESQVTPTPTLAPALPVPEAALARLPAESNASWTPIIESVDGIEMVLVPSGCFVYGPPTVSSKERAARRVCFETPFWIDRTEVTNADFIRLGGVARAQAENTQDDVPRTALTWDEALAFCQLRGGLLPTALEWEYAARGVESWLYPWGETFDPARVVFRDTFDLPGQGQPKPRLLSVESRPNGASWVGAVHLLGNAAEWVLNPLGGEPFARPRTLRGGSALNNTLSVTAEEIRATELSETTPTQYDGFRCVRR